MNTFGTYKQLALVSSKGQSASFNASGCRFLYVYASCVGKAATAMVPVSILRSDKESYIFGAAYNSQFHGIWIEIQLSNNGVTLVDAMNNGESTTDVKIYINGIK